MPKQDDSALTRTQNLTTADFDDDDEVIDLLEVVKPGNIPPVDTNSDDVDFSKDLESMLDSLSQAEKAKASFPDPTPVEHEVDHNESLDLPDMDDLDELLLSLGAEAPKKETPAPLDETQDAADATDDEASKDASNLDSAPLGRPMDAERDEFAALLGALDAPDDDEGIAADDILSANAPLDEPDDSEQDDSGPDAMPLVETGEDEEPVADTTAETVDEFDGLDGLGELVGPEETPIEEAALDEDAALAELDLALGDIAPAGLDEPVDLAALEEPDALEATPEPESEPESAPEPEPEPEPKQEPKQEPKPEIDAQVVAAPQAQSVSISYEEIAAASNAQSASIPADEDDAVLDQPQSGSGLDEVDLVELDALLDDMLAGAPASGPGPGSSESEPLPSPPPPAATQSPPADADAPDMAFAEITALRGEIESLRSDLNDALALMSTTGSEPDADSAEDALPGPTPADLAGRLEELELTLSARATSADADTVQLHTDQLGLLDGRVEALDDRLEALEVLREQVAAMSGKLDDLENNLADLTANLDKLAAEAAARVIREELAALMAESTP